MCDLHRDYLLSSWHTFCGSLLWKYCKQLNSTPLCRVFQLDGNTRKAIASPHPMHRALFVSHDRELLLTGSRKSGKVRKPHDRQRGHATGVSDSDAIESKTRTTRTSYLKKSASTLDLVSVLTGNFLTRSLRRRVLGVRTGLIRTVCEIRSFFATLFIRAAAFQRMIVVRLVRRV